MTTRLRTSVVVSLLAPLMPEGLEWFAAEIMPQLE
jgi:hypothetical protein